MHRGSNGANLFVMWITPKLGLSVIVANNASGGKAAILDQIALDLGRRLGARA